MLSHVTLFARGLIGKSKYLLAHSNYGVAVNVRSNPPLWTSSDSKDAKQHASADMREGWLDGLWDLLADNKQKEKDVHNKRADHPAKEI